MIERFLRLFRKFGDLETANRALEVDLARARDESVFWQSRAESLERRFNKAVERERELYHSLLFPSASSPPRPPTEPVPAPRVQAYRLIQQRNHEFVAELTRRLEEVPNDTDGRSANAAANS